MDMVKVLVENYGTLSVILFTAFGTIVKCRRYIKNAIRSLILGDRFYVVFGENPAEAIKAIHDAIQTSYEVCELRQQITERHIKIGIYICDTTGRCSWSNEYLNEIFALDSKDMRGFGWLQAIAQEDRKRVNEHWLYSIHNDIVYDCDYTIVNKRDGILIDVTTTAIAVKDDHDKVQCYVGYLQINKMTGMKTKDGNIAGH